MHPEPSTDEVLHRGECQQFLHLAVGQYDVGGALQRLIITPLISIAQFRGANEPSDFCQQNRDVINRGLIVSIEQLVDTDDHIGERMEPGKPRVVHYKLEELACGVNSAINPLIGQLLGDNQSFMQA